MCFESFCTFSLAMYVQLFPSGKIRVDFIGERESNISGGQFAVNILHCNASIRNMSRVQDTGCRLQTLVENMHGPSSSTLIRNRKKQFCLGSATFATLPPPSLRSSSQVSEIGSG